MKKTLLCMALLCMAACAPALPSKINVSKIPETESRVLSEFNSGEMRLGVDPFVDSRKEAWVAEVEGERKILPDSDVGLAVQLAFKQALTKSGVRTPSFDSAKLAGEVLDWKVNVKVDFPTSIAAAQARIKVYLLDANDSLLYSGTYEGSSEMEHPYLEDHIEETLGNAMSYAVREALSDLEIVNRLTKGARAIKG